MIDSKKLKSLVKFKTISVSTQQVVVNNQPIIIDNKHSVLVCPNCDMPIIDFNQEVSINDVVNFCKTNYNNLMLTKHQCPNCQQELDYTFDIIDAEYKELGSEEIE